jgi:chromosomal replication initiator protein
LGWGLTVDIEFSEKDTEIECSIEQIHQAVAHFFNIKVSELLSYRKNKVFVYPRHVAMYLSHKLLDLTFLQIARAFERKDHTTVIYAAEKIRRACMKDEKVQNIIREIESFIKKQLAKKEG